MLQPEGRVRAGGVFEGEGNGFECVCVVFEGEESGFERVCGVFEGEGSEFESV